MFPIVLFPIVTDTAQKMKFSIKELVTFTEEILNGKLHFLSNADNLQFFHLIKYEDKTTQSCTDCFFSENSEIYKIF